jgi:glycosyltransferase involved in cell wall biosynthesis
VTDLHASVVVNNHNYERFVGQAIESALAQTHRRTEVIVVDDGSTDGSREVISGFGDRIVRIFQENSGQASALTAGYQAAQGDVVCFLDADDALDPCALADACRELERSSAVCVHWPLREVVDGTPTGQVRPHGPIPAGDRLEALLAEGPDSQVHPPTSGSLWRRDFLERCFPLPVIEHELAATSANVDAYLASLAPLYGPVGSLSEPRAIYRLHAQSNYRALPFAERLRRDLVTFRVRCEAVAEHGARLGYAVEPARWIESSWVPRLKRAADEVVDHLPPDTAFALIDQDQWGMEAVGSRRALPFPQRDGEYWGPPAEDGEAVRELERLRSEGVGYVVVGWPAFWWLEYYPSLAAELAACYRRVTESDELIIFQLSSQA